MVRMSDVLSVGSVIEFTRDIYAEPKADLGKTRKIDKGTRARVVFIIPFVVELPDGSDFLLHNPRRYAEISKIVG